MTRFSEEQLGEILNRKGYRAREADAEQPLNLPEHWPPPLSKPPPPPPRKAAPEPPQQRESAGLALRRHDQLEQAEQEALIAWAQLRTFRHTHPDGSTQILTLSDVLIAIPNGAYLQGDRKRRAIQANMLKRTGMKPGVPDLLLKYARRAPGGEILAAGLFIEMKRRRDQFRCEADIRRALSPAQERELELCRLAGYDTAVAFGWHEAARQICGYMGWEEAGL